MEKTIKIDPTLMDPDKYDDHKIEEDAEILLEAEEIKKDPKRMEKVNAFLDSKKKKITSLKQLKDIANNYTDDQDDEDSEDKED